MKKIFLAMVCVILVLGVGGCSKKVDESAVNKKCTEYTKTLADSNKKLSFGETTTSLEKDKSELYSCNFDVSINSYKAKINLSYDNDINLIGFKLSSNNVDDGGKLDMSGLSLTLSNNKELNLEKDFKEGMQTDMLQFLDVASDTLSGEHDNYKYALTYDNTSYLMMLYKNDITK